ncbi:hypothetical protein BJV82DRAFT_588558 [Fennellomyces sp. T-0311]|nr:hypothetical protein BJV82DRAFT_588558 [Fennellomyces sp. T-0311]
MDTTIALPPRSSRRNRRVCVVMPYDGQQRPKLDKQYRARSYSEMMETKDTCERLALYEKTFELCMRADPQLTSWIKRVKQKGVPKAMIEGYKPRRSESSSASSDNSSTTSRRSFSVFLRKASALPSNPRGCSSLPPDPLKSSASRFIATSISKLSSLSRQPHHQQQPQQQPRRSYDRSTSLVPSASAKIKRRLSSQHQRLFSSTTTSTRTAPSSNNTTSTTTASKKPSESPATHSVFLDRLRLRRSHEPMVGVDITHHASKIIAVRV